MRRRVTIMAIAVIVVACGSEERVATTTSSPADPTTTASTAVEPTTTSTVDRTTTTTSIPATTSTTQPEIDIELVGGEIVGPERFEVPLGETVDIWILSDVDDEVHVHGYDLRFEISAGEPFNLSFDADVPGIFEVEAHTSSAPLFEIEVTG
jgi:hypothetical protein